MPHALVTGGAGFIGSNLVDRLLAEEYDVTVVDDMSNGHAEFLEGAKIGELLKTSFASADVLNRVRGGGFDYIFHEAALPRVSFSVEHPVETSQVNIMD